jgi:hypothetical protein
MEAQRICEQFFCGEQLVGGFAGRFGEQIVLIMCNVASCDTDTESLWEITDSGEDVA